ncbi:hypothetical protein OPQ81_008666 [Rhizoctonia solani]|nr:hypothetical protein OPQ81_008666 [Rhizoctonia solani]
MSDVDLGSEWSSNEGEDGRSFIAKGKARARLLRSPRRTVEGDRPRRSQSERLRGTIESDRPRQTSESEPPRNDRPSADQKRFRSLLHVRERARVVSTPTKPDRGVLEPPKLKSPRTSWLTGLKFTRSPAASRPPSPSPVPSLDPIPSLSPITSRLGPILQVSPATPAEKSIFGSVGEDVCSERVPETEPWSRVTGGSCSADGGSEHKPRMLSRGNSARAQPPQRPVPSRPIPATPPEFILPDDRRQREATIRPSSRSRPPSATELGLNGDTYDKPSFLDELDVVSDDDYGEDIPPGTATTVDEPRIAGTHRPQLSMSSRVPVTESNIRWSAAGRSRSGSNASATQWRGASVYVESDQDQDDYGVPSPIPPPDLNDDLSEMQNGYGGLIGPRRDLYSDDELESVLEENESLSDHDREDRTAAMIIADEGRGLIVDAERRPVSQLDVQTGTTHLLLGSSPTPSLVPPFLAQVLPEISSTLLCLDISNNELGALPAALTSCTQLEELNVSNNPLRSLPSSLGALISLRVLIADSCELQSLPSQLVHLGALHSLSVRSNRLVMLPVWMCAMPGLEVLKIEGNTFAGPWRNLVEPLLPRDTSSSPPPPKNGVYSAARAANSLPLLSTTTNESGVLASPILLNRPGAGVQRSYSQVPQPTSALEPRWSGNGISPISSPYPTSNSAPHSPPRHALSPPHVTMSPPPSTGFAHLQLPVQPPPTTAALNMHLGALAPAPRKRRNARAGAA